MVKGCGIVFVIQGKFKIGFYFFYFYNANVKLLRKPDKIIKIP